MAATLKLLPTEQIPGDAARGWNLTDLLRRVAAEHEQGDGIDDTAEAADIEAAATEAPATTADDASTPASEAERTPDVVMASKPEPDAPWIDALDLAIEATDAIRAADERIARLEAQNRELEKYLETEVRSLHGRVKTADELVARAEAAKAAAEERAREAERRADAVEIWLGRIRDQLTSIRPQAVARLKRA
jgi:small-conductance mechanosensitive channel